MGVEGRRVMGFIHDHGRLVSSLSPGLTVRLTRVDVRLSESVGGWRGLDIRSLGTVNTVLLSMPFVFR